MSLVIRRLEQTDFTPNFFETLGSLAPVDLTIEEAIAIWKERAASGIYSCIAELDDEIVGAASLIVERKFIHRGRLAGHIEDVAVHSDHWRKGIGSALVKHLTQVARELRCYKVTLNCHERLVPFYSGIGYRRHDAGLRIDCAFDSHG